MHNSQMTEQMRQCITNCLQCHADCTETLTHCLMRGGDHAAPPHQKLLGDCAQACITSADFMLRMSDYHTEYCRLCADLCRACGEDCERLASGDHTMLKCAESCRRCEQTCRDMAMAAA
jgi:hypothetical protein